MQSRNSLNDLFILCFMFCTEIAGSDYRSKTFIGSIFLEARYSYSSLLQEISQRSNIKCGMQCASNNDCVSFFYNTDTEACLLMTKIWTDTIDTIPQAGWTYFIKQGLQVPPDFTFLSNSSLNIKYHDATGTMRNYSEMQTICQNEGGELLKIRNDVERLDVAHFLQNNAGSSPLLRVVFQGKEERPSGIWYFDDGSEISYLPWATNPQQPNTDTHNCLYLKSPYLFWWDGECEINAAFICEI